MAWNRILMITILMAALLMASTVVWAEVNDLEISWWTVDGGGGLSGSGNYTLSGTIGQPDAGVLAGGSYTLRGGFWAAPSTLVWVYTTHLPLILKAP